MELHQAEDKREEFREDLQQIFDEAVATRTNIR